MRRKITEISCKEVISICDGTKYGYVNDVEVDCNCGKIVAIIVHCKAAGSFLPKRADVVIPWESIKCIGEDIILVDYMSEIPIQNRKTGIFSK